MSLKPNEIKKKQLIITVGLGKHKAVCTIVNIFFCKQGDLIIIIWSLYIP